ncbi:Endoglucanase-4 [Cytospora mali]|uniref:lytic cellulose monooxygenase (C4-dehydrogenating) n=1 Tax=Cytospora mali TaxID=578113 RepID=A0A194V529_CYTMA|nr:Endoglucanase-4 [Valsa mali var. pyri (nom. inval.)]
MPSVSPIALALAAGATLVSAHGYASSWDIGGVTYKGFDEMWAVAQGTDTGNEFIAWSTSASDNGYVAPDAYTSGDIICHRGATNGKLNNATVAAGDSIKVTWNTWPDSHKGPIIDYLAPADDPTTVDKTSLEFIKIQEKGLVSGSNPGTWATDNLISDGLTWEIPIPADLKPGNYVLRHEIIALHSAYSSDGAQNYPQCVNIQVTGSGSSLPSGTLGESLYTETDPGILFNLYEAFTSYSIPGPELAFSGSSSSSGSSASSAVSSSAAAATSVAAATSSAAAAATSSAAAVQTTSAAAANAAAPTSASSSAAAATSSAAAKTCKKRRHARDVKA